MKNLILIVGCLLILVPCQAAEQEEQNQWQLENIEKYISQQRHNIENYYKGQLVELNQRAESEIRLLEVADKAVYAGLAAQAEAAKTVLNIDSSEYRMLQIKDDGEFADSIKKSPVRFAVAQSLIAERKSRILANLEWEVVKLEQRKQYALTAGLERLEKRLKENLLKPKPEVTHGVVTGILYCPDKPSAVIDNKIVHEGDTIKGVKVIKIFKDKVVFEKKGRGWDQKVQEKPASYW